jgi:hypothetical protein
LADGGAREGAGASAANSDAKHDERGIAVDAIDEVRVAGVLEALSEDVRPGERCDAAALSDLTVCVEDRETESVR